MTTYSEYTDATQATTWTVEYKVIVDAMTNKPSTADTIIQNTLVKGLVDGGYFAKAELLDMFSVHNNNEALINWRNPGTFNPSLNSTPLFTNYAGFTGNGGLGYVNLNFNPAANGTLISQNNICLMWGIGNDVDESRYDIGGQDGAGIILRSRSRYTNNSGWYCNDGSLRTVVNNNSIKHYAMSRGAANNYDSYINLSKTNHATNSTGLINIDLYACAMNNNTVPNVGNKQVRYVFLFSYLNETEITAVTNLIEVYLDNYGTGLI